MKTYYEENIARRIGISDWQEMNEIPDDVNLTFDGHLILPGVTRLPKGCNLTAAGTLNLRILTSLSEGTKLAAGGSISLDFLKSLPADCSLVSGMSLIMDYTTSLSEGCRLIAGTHLNLPSLESLSSNCNLSAGKRIWLNSLVSLSESYNVAAGREVYAPCLSNADYYSLRSHVTRLKNGDYVEGKYLCADGNLTPIREKRKCGEYTLYIGELPRQNVVSDGTYYAHCNKFRDGIADLKFKAAADRGACQYKGLDPDTEMTVPELVTMYRVITGACRAGSEHFVESLGSLKEKYTIREAIQITEGQYNSGKFALFFGM